MRGPEATTTVIEAALVSSCASSGPLSLHKLMTDKFMVSFRLERNVPSNVSENFPASMVDLIVCVEAIRFVAFYELEKKN